MRILAIETAAKTVGLALLEEDRLLAEVHLDLGRHHAEVLLPALEQLLRIAGWNPEQIDLFACSSGPGSFTGVRIGVSTVKGLALAFGRRVVGVSTLEALAVNAGRVPQRICPMLDARKEQVYCGLYRTGKDGLPETVIPERLSGLDEWLEAIRAEEVLFLGDGALRYEPRIREAFPEGLRMGEAWRHHPRASAVGLIARNRHREGRSLDPLMLAPHYLRLSEAESRSGTGGPGLCGEPESSADRS